jgi:hypothetical protein
MSISDDEKKTLLKRFHQSLTESPLEPDAAIYVKELHQSDPTHDAVAQLAQQISFNESAAAYLFTCQIGTGKSTELRRLRQLLVHEGCFVGLADRAQFVNLTTPIGIGDLLIAIMGAYAEAVEELTKTQVATESLWQRLGDFLQTKVKIEGLDLGGNWAKLKLGLQRDHNFKKQLQDQVHGHLSALVEEATGFADEMRVVVAQSRHIQPADLKVVLILDSLERIRGQGTANDPVMQSVRELFTTYADRLRLPGMHIVYSVSPYLLKLAPHLTAILGGNVICNLTSAHIFRDHSHAPDPKGLAVLRKIVEKRCAEWFQVLNESQLDRLILASGVDLRDYFRLLKTYIARAAAGTEIVLPIGDEVIADAEDQVRRDMLPIPKDTIVRLQYVADNFQPKLDTEQDMDLLIRDLQFKRVLMYRNGADWYDVHPLLRDTVNATAGQPGGEAR